MTDLSPPQERSEPEAIAYEYTVVVSARKTNGPPPEGEGWEPYYWTDTDYWRRPVRGES
jgi:hypothetical protein